MNTATKIVLASLVSLHLAACGGGGGGGGSSDSGAAPSADQATAVPDSQQETDVNVTAASYTPNGDLLISEAEASNDLYVEEGFAFTSSDQVTLQVTAADADASPLTYIRVSVYLVPSDLEAWSDESLEEAALIGSGMTNASGLFQRVLDVPQYDAQFLVVLHTIGIENKALIDIDSESLSYHFE